MRWRTSSYSAANSTCVQVGTDGGPLVAFRNSNHPDRGALALPTAAVATFVAACRAGELDDLTT